MSRNMVSNQENLTNPIEDKLHFPQMQLDHFYKKTRRPLQQKVAGLNWANLFSLKTPGRNFYWKLWRLGKTDLFVCLTNQPLLPLRLPPVMSLDTKNTLNRSCWSPDESYDFSYMTIHLAPKVLPASEPLFSVISLAFSRARLLFFTLLLGIISPPLSSSKILSAEFFNPEITTHGSATLVRFSSGIFAMNRRDKKIKKIH